MMEKGLPVSLSQKKIAQLSKTKHEKKSNGWTEYMYKICCKTFFCEQGARNMSHAENKTEIKIYQCCLIEIHLDNLNPNKDHKKLLILF
jgi:hypothetical protein